MITIIGSDLKLIIVRHGETEENNKGIMMGHRQGKLSKRGINQARMLAIRLKRIKIDFVFSSDLKRVKDTTKEIMKYHKVPIIYTEMLREQNYGVFQGKRLDKFLAAFNSSGDGDIRFRPKGGESLVDVRERVKLFAIKLSGRRYRNKTILISTHSGIIWCLYSIYKHVPLVRALKIQIKNADFVTFKV